ncbi:MAG: peptide chain release factor N(5)-glutamine methyltransferase [Alphaproteobacteria bacterium]|nr:peptide chain release factor N(5)-glutamine methyltransferase [Alphaproteobacteria bacterium]
MTVAADDRLTDATRMLAAAGIANARREMRLLEALADGDETRFVEYIRRRAAHEPYSRIRGAREFWSLDLALSPETLDPRPDSETLIEAALALLPDRAAAIEVLDLGTGTGALLLAFLTEFRAATGFGVDIAAGAVETARRNATALGLAARANFVTGDWAEINLDPADVILANPPYIPTDALAKLPPEIARFDPRVALDGGRDGLAAYRVLAPVVHRVLRPQGVAFFELGAGQAEMAGRIVAGCGLRAAGTRCDLAGRERCLMLRHA